MLMFQIDNRSAAVFMMLKLCFRLSISSYLGLTEDLNLSYLTKHTVEKVPSSNFSSVVAMVSAVKQTFSELWGWSYSAGWCGEKVKTYMTVIGEKKFAGPRFDRSRSSLHQRCTGTQLPFADYPVSVQTYCMGSYLLDIAQLKWGR